MRASLASALGHGLQHRVGGEVRELWHETRARRRLVDLDLGESVVASIEEVEVDLRIGLVEDGAEAFEVLRLPFAERIVHLRLRRELEDHSPHVAQVVVHLEAEAVHRSGHAFVDLVDDLAVHDPPEHGQRCQRDDRGEGDERGELGADGVEPELHRRVGEHMAHVVAEPVVLGVDGRADAVLRARARHVAARIANARLVS